MSLNESITEEDNLKVIDKIHEASLASKMLNEAANNQDSNRTSLWYYESEKKKKELLEILTDLDAPIYVINKISNTQPGSFNETLTDELKNWFLPK